MSMKFSPASRRRGGFKAVILLIGFFAFLLAVTWERVTVRELNSRIEQLEDELQSLETDEAMLRVSIERESRFLDVQRIASEKWGMSVAHPRQRVLVASWGDDAEGLSISAEQSPGLAARVGQLIRPSASWAASMGDRNAAQGH